MAAAVILHPASQLVEDWAAHLARDRRRSPNTIRAYVATAHRLISFLGDHTGEDVTGQTLRELEAADLRSYLAHRRMEGLVNRSAARELSAVRGFLAFVTGRDGEEADLPRVKGPKLKPGVPRPVAPNEAVKLAEDVATQADEPWVAARDWAVLLLLYGSGLRVGEALGLTGAALPLGDTLSVTGKRNKTRIVPLLGKVREAIENYIELCPYPIGRDDPLFRGVRGGPPRQRYRSQGRARRESTPRPFWQDNAARAAPQLRDAPAGARRGSALATGTARPC